VKNITVHLVDTIQDPIYRG